MKGMTLTPFDSELIQQHRSHDYRFLIRCWRALAREAELRMRTLITVHGLPVYAVMPAGPKRDERAGIYISAGVHGDEVAGPWGLLKWAQEHVELLKRERFLLLPTLNPHGMILNTRADLDGRDLNRLFHDTEHELMAAWRGLLAGWRFSLGLCLHEDYDGQGCYVYELTKERRVMGHAILQDCAAVIPVDERRNMDGHRANHGVIVRRVAPEMAGRPEAIVLQEIGTPLVLTFESPSEFSLVERIKVQKVFVSSALRHVLAL